MKVVVIEDELPAANRLVKMLSQIDPAISVVQRLDSIEAAVAYFDTEPKAELIFMDIQLADGLSFDIFTQTRIKAPVIFTTAFDQYTLKAFKVNSVDYLLKPIEETELRQAIEKYRHLFAQQKMELPDQILQLVQQMNSDRYKERLLIKRGQQLSYIKTENVAFCYADGKLCFAVDFQNVKYLLENHLTQLEEQLHPSRFFRINRNLLVNIEAVQKVHTWLGSRLKIEVLPATTAETVVSRERVNRFKEWLGQ
jgi:DNA-binding LytR/AlgR family response regulator